LPLYFHIFYLTIGKKKPLKYSIPGCRADFTNDQGQGLY